MARVQLEFIRPGRPMGNGHMKCFNGRFRDKGLIAYAFLSMAKARDIVEAWRQDYNSAVHTARLEVLAPEEIGRAMNEEYQTGQ